MIIFCKHFDHTTRKCDLFKEDGPEDLICFHDGECGYPFEMIPDGFTCDHFVKGVEEQ